MLTEKTWAMLLVTTIGIGLSATPLKNVPGTEPLSMTFVYIYMTMIGASADLRELAGAGTRAAARAPARRRPACPRARCPGRAARWRRPA